MRAADPPALDDPTPNRCSIAGPVTPLDNGPATREGRSAVSHLAPSGPGRSCGVSLTDLFVFGAIVGACLVGLVLVGAAWGG